MVYLIMGVMGSGKTTVGIKLSQRLGCMFHDGDDYHSKSNIEKMQKGIPLNDEDRKPWIFAIRAVLDSELCCVDKAVLTCSALKEKYRKTLIGGRPEVKLIYLKGSKELIRKRIMERDMQNAHNSLLDSQFEDLEEPENALVIDINKSVDDIVEEIVQSS